MVQGFYMFVRAVQLLTQRNDGTIVVRWQQILSQPHVWPSHCIFASAVHRLALM